MNVITETDNTVNVVSPPIPAIVKLPATPITKHIGNANLLIKIGSNKLYLKKLESFSFLTALNTTNKTKAINVYAENMSQSLLVSGCKTGT